MGNMLRFVKLFVELGHTVTVESKNKLTITRSNGNSVKIVRLPVRPSSSGHTFDLYTQYSDQPVAYYIGWSKGYDKALETIQYALSEMS